jgi:hypothetical protein
MTSTIPRPVTSTSFTHGLGAPGPSSRLILLALTPASTIAAGRQYNLHQPQLHALPYTSERIQHTGHIGEGIFFSYPSPCISGHGLMSRLRYIPAQTLHCSRTYYIDVYATLFIHQSDRKHSISCTKTCRYSSLTLMPISAQ